MGLGELDGQVWAGRVMEAVVGGWGCVSPVGWNIGSSTADGAGKAGCTHGDRSSRSRTGSRVVLLGTCSFDGVVGAADRWSRAVGGMRAAGGMRAVDGHILVRLCTAQADKLRVVGKGRGQVERVGGLLAGTVMAGNRSSPAGAEAAMAAPHQQADAAAFLGYERMWCHKLNLRVARAVVKALQCLAGD